MPYLNDDIIEAAYVRDKFLGGRVRTLSKFAVVGFIEKPEYDSTVQFLNDAGVAFDTNGDTLLWLGVLDTSLIKLFKKLKADA